MFGSKKSVYKVMKWYSRHFVFAAATLKMVKLRWPTMMFDLSVTKKYSCQVESLSPSEIF